jgi:hypothetical protein
MENLNFSSFLGVAHGDVTTPSKLAGPWRYTGLVFMCGMAPVEHFDTEPDGVRTIA